MMTSTPTPNALAPAVKDAEWDEARIDDAEKRLKELFIQLRHLRNTIPNIIKSFMTDDMTTEEFVNAVSKTAYSSQNDVKEFKKLWADPKTQKVFEYVRRSRASNGEGIVPFKITQHPEWMNRP